MTRVRQYNEKKPQEREINISRSCNFLFYNLSFDFLSFYLLSYDAGSLNTLYQKSLTDEIYQYQRRDYH